MIYPDFIVIWWLGESSTSNSVTAGVSLLKRSSNSYIHMHYLYTHMYVCVRRCIYVYRLAYVCRYVHI